MATKPATLPRWANVGGAVVTPSSGKLDVGYVAGERPPAQYANFLQLWNYRWAEYLNDGALQGAHTFDSTVGITGLLTATGGVTCGANASVTVSGTGKYKRPARMRKLMPNDGTLISGTAPIQALGYIQMSTNTILHFALDVEEGERLTSVSLRCQDGGASDLVYLKVYRNDCSGAVFSTVQLGTTSQSTGSTGVSETVTVSGLTETSGSQFYNYFARVEQSGAASGIIVAGVYYTTDVV